MDRCQNVLPDVSLPLLRGMNETYMTRFTRSRKVQRVLTSLEHCASSNSGKHARPCLERLKELAIGHSRDDESHRPPDGFMDLIIKLETSFWKLEQLDGVLAKVVAGAEAGSANHENAQFEIDRLAQEFGDILCKLDNDEDELYQQKYDAELALREYEDAIFLEWQRRKQATERCQNWHAMARGMRNAIMATNLHAASVHTRHLEKCYLEPQPPWERQSCPHGVEQNDQAHPWVQMAADGFEAAFKPDPSPEDLGDKVCLPRPGAESDDLESTAASVQTLSDVMAAGTRDQAERENVWRHEHPGSAGHPHLCRPCHFQASGCRKGLACSFCHICPKPKRKSKHQRDVGKRRQERYQIVKDQIGEDCLDFLTQIDQRRRQFMTSSDELKKKLKQAYQSSDGDQECVLRELKATVHEMILAMDKYHGMHGELLTREGVFCTAI